MTIVAWAAIDGPAGHRWLASAMALVLGLAGGLGLLRAEKNTRGNTLAAAWRWACLSFAALAAGELLTAWLADDRSAPWAAHARYLAGITTLTPYVALLGAKRPQDRAWHWIVLALLLLLTLPSGKAALFDAGAPPSPHTAWRLLLAILLTSQLVNYLPTRFWSTALLIALAQMAWLWDYLPGVAGPPQGRWPLAGLALATAAIWLGQLPPPRARKSRSPIDRLWLDFRDAYGALWALRVAERFNRSAKRYGWPMRLAWGGLEEGERRKEKGEAQEKGERRKEKGGRSDEEEAPSDCAMHRNLRSLLLRFVSPEWIAQRMGHHDPSFDT